MNTLSLWGIALSRLDFLNETSYVYTYLRYEDFLEKKASADDIDGISNFLNSVDDGIATIILAETKPHTIKMSLRSTKSDVDVSAIAKAFGGGGHKKAAGATITGKTIEEVKEEIVACINTGSTQVA